MDASVVLPAADGDDVSGAEHIGVRDQPRKETTPLAERHTLVAVEATVFEQLRVRFGKSLERHHSASVLDAEGGEVEPPLRAPRSLPERAEPRARRALVAVEHETDAHLGWMRPAASVVYGVAPVVEAERALPRPVRPAPRGSKLPILLFRLLPARSIERQPLDDRFGHLGAQTRERLPSRSIALLETLYTPPRLRRRVETR